MGLFFSLSPNPFSLNLVLVLNYYNFYKNINVMQYLTYKNDYFATKVKYTTK